MNKIFRCKNCLNMSTRPRIKFDSRGWCNACVWMEEKKTLDWGARRKELQCFLNKYRSPDGGFDCIVPCSGGKDGSSIAYRLKHLCGMNPLTVTVAPPLSLDIGNRNLTNFIESGYDHIHIHANNEIMRKLNKIGLVEKGFPYYGWLELIKKAVIRVALNFGVYLIFYAEDGEVEYGGSTETKNRASYDLEYIKRVYFEGGLPPDIEKRFSKKDLYWWSFPSEEELKNKALCCVHWSYFENWDPYKNYLIAKEHCGLQEQENSNQGTFTNFAQNDQALYALHTYLMYLKFGFGRATRDAGIEIRRGALTREQALYLVRMYDNNYPEDYIPMYLDYYRMSQKEFDEIIDKWANKNLFEKRNGRWEPTFKVE
ncbi:MAG: N-acetyl sugar amidotransferase [Victivallaceae bacterium]|nr:N-acetyl sugar amidotransferase [Victivallaceae bacterium]